MSLSLYWIERRVEIMGPRIRKPYRNSRLARELAQQRTKVDAMEAAAKRLARVLL